MTSEICFLTLEAAEGSSSFRVVVRTLTMFGKGEAEGPPPDDEPPEPLPPAPAGISREAWSKADTYERKRLLRLSRG